MPRLQQAAAGVVLTVAAIKTVDFVTSKLQQRCQKKGKATSDHQTFQDVCATLCCERDAMAAQVTRTDNLEQQLLLATQGNDSIVSELRAVQTENGELQVHIQSLVSTNRDALGESQLLRHQAESLQQQMSVLQHDARQNQDAAEENNSQLRQNLFQATQAHDIAADDLQVATQDIRALHGQVDDLSHENQGLHSRAASLQRELTSYQRKFTQAEERTRTLNKDHERHLGDLQAEAADQKKRHSEALAAQSADFAARLQEVKDSATSTAQVQERKIGELQEVIAHLKMKTNSQDSSGEISIHAEAEKTQKSSLIKSHPGAVAEQDPPLPATHAVVPVIKTTSEPRGVTDKRDGSSSNDTATLGDAQEGGSAMPTSHIRGQAVEKSTLSSTTDNGDILKTEAAKKTPAVHEIVKAAKTTGAAASIAPSSTERAMRTTVGNTLAKPHAAQTQQQTTAELQACVSDACGPDASLASPLQKQAPAAPVPHAAPPSSLMAMLARCKSTANTAGSSRPVQHPVPTPGVQATDATISSSLPARASLSPDDEVPVDGWEACSFNTASDVYMQPKAGSFIASGTTADVFWARRLKHSDSSIADSDLVAVKHLKPVTGSINVDLLNSEKATLEALAGRKFMTPLYSVHMPPADLRAPQDAYLVMGLAQGKNAFSLCQAVNKAALQMKPGAELDALTAWAWKFGMQFAGCMIKHLFVLHKKDQYFHRDLKPLNVVVSGWSGEKLGCTIVDWASACHMDRRGLHMHKPQLEDRF